MFTHPYKINSAKSPGKFVADTYVSSLKARKTNTHRAAEIK